MFSGNGNKWHEEKIFIDIENRDFSVDQKDLEYTIIGESCIPSIESNNFRSIFEEQIVTQSLNSTGINIQQVVNGNVFSIRDNTFYFGNIIPSKYP